MKLDPARVEGYLAARLGQAVHLRSITPLGSDDISSSSAPGGKVKRLKSFGYGKPLLLLYEMGGQEHRAVLGTVSRNSFGHEYRADRAANQILSYDTYNELPRHVQAADLGVLLPGGDLLSLAEADEFFLITEFVEGQLYAVDLQRLRDNGDCTSLDRARARSLASYLASIHRVKRDEPTLYQRRARDLIGSGEGLMGLVDSYPADYPLAGRARLQEIEKACLSWRWRLKEKGHRLAQVHGDFHPFNILFGEGVDFRLLDRSRGAWGEPGDDVSCLVINFLFFSLQRSGRLDTPFTELWDTFWDTYLEASGDQEILSVVAPYFAWRGLVVASPVWYQIEDQVRRAIFRFIERVLGEDEFDPASVHAYLAP
jgi:aminoglycoside phosphotransferase (APT) family kinase protein